MNRLRIHQVDNLVEKARPFAEAMKIFKQLLTRKFNQYVLFKVSFTWTKIVSNPSTVFSI